MQQAEGENQQTKNQKSKGFQSWWWGQRGTRSGSTMKQAKSDNVKTRIVNKNNLFRLSHGTFFF